MEFVQFHPTGMVWPPGVIELLVTEAVRGEGGILRKRNITKCCSEVCPEGIHITDNAIIPLKERVVDRRYDPLFKLARRIAARRRR